MRRAGTTTAGGSEEADRERDREADRERERQRERDRESVCVCYRSENIVEVLHFLREQRNERRWHDQH